MKEVERTELSTQGKDTFVNTPEAFEKAKVIAAEIMPTLYEKTNGDFLLALQALDLMMNVVQGEAIQLKMFFDKEVKEGGK